MPKMVISIASHKLFDGDNALQRGLQRKTQYKLSLLKNKDYGGFDPFSHLVHSLM